MQIIERHIAGAFIFSADERILLGHGGVFKGAWLVPGGGVNKNETPLEAMKREVEEESGLASSVARYGYRIWKNGPRLTYASSSLTLSRGPCSRN